MPCLEFKAALTSRLRTGLEDEKQCRIDKWLASPDNLTDPGCGAAQARVFLSADECLDDRLLAPGILMSG